MGIIFVVLALIELEICVISKITLNLETKDIQKYWVLILVIRLLGVRPKRALKTM